MSNKKSLNPKNIVSQNDNNNYNHTNTSYNESFSNKLILPVENASDKHSDESSFSSIMKKNNLLFEEKNVFASF